jgi:hypothetical protein
MGKYSPPHYNPGFAPTITEKTGEAIVLGSKEVGNKYIEARRTEKYNELGQKTGEAVKITSNIQDPADLEKAIELLGDRPRTSFRLFVIGVCP